MAQLTELPVDIFRVASGKTTLQQPEPDPEPVDGAQPGQCRDNPLVRGKNRDVLSGEAIERGLGHQPLQPPPHTAGPDVDASGGHPPYGRSGGTGGDGRRPDRQIPRPDGKRSG
ncbi:hypothetical protein [Corynebacterium atypicum]|uniref:hypothetical protein n=1 Tax=Corynebacterium atypicum TaxID=191610 RepID=UPI0011865981|nr:hypothetical protein [Corynebacterium atypicum]